MQPSKIKGHPQEKKIIDAILNGESERSIASWADPRVSFGAVHRYKRNVLRPVVAKAAVLAKVVGANAIDVGNPDSEAVAQSAGNVARSALLAAPILQRMEARESARQEVMSKALDDKDFRAWASLDRNGLTSDELTARLTGALDAPGAGPHVSNTYILLPTIVQASQAQPAPRQLAAEDIEVIK